MPGAALALDASGRVVFCNAAAEALLRQGGAVAVSADGSVRFDAFVASERQALAARIATVLALSAGKNAPLAAPMRLSRRSGHAALLVLAAPLAPTAACCDPHDAARALLLFFDPAASAAVAAETLRQAVGLTPAETRAAALIGGGMTVPQAAAALGLSPATLKTQLTRCFEKTGVRSQVALARLLAALPPASAAQHRP